MIQRHKRSRPPAVRILFAAVAVYLGLTIMLGLLQRKLIYVPSRADESRLLLEAAGVGLVPWRNDAGAVVGWKTPGQGRNRMVVFHGNAGFALHRTYYVEGLQSVADGESLWQVHVLEYPGYGARGGRPSRKTFLEAGRQALDALRRDELPVYLCGESIGSGVACALAAEKPEQIAGLLLITPFATLADVAAHHVPLFPVRLILRERYDNSDALKAYDGPVAVLLADRDEVIPREMGERLYREYHGPKKLWVRAATHNTLDLSAGNPWWQEASDFLLKAGKSSVSE
jgi:uncharacterized protein